MKSVNCVIVGDGMVGKTTLARTFVGQQLSEAYEATVLNHFKHNITVAGKHVGCNIFDTTGEHYQKEFRCICYAKCDVFILCYSINDRNSFESIKDFWIPEIAFMCGKNVSLILVATHNDDCVNCADDNDKVSSVEGRRLAQDIEAAHFVECSSVITQAVQSIFEKAVASTLKRRNTTKYVLSRILGK